MSKNIEREDIVDHASMAGAKSSLTPLATTNSLMLDDSAHLPNPKEYQVLLVSSIISQ